MAVACLVPLTAPFAAWTTDTAVNTPICLYTGEQWNTVAVSDGAGGAIIAWQDRRAGYPDDNIYARRVDANGNPLWTADGVVICNAADVQSYPRIVSDGAGGAIIAWLDRRYGGNPTNIFAQRVDGNGNVLWTGNGVPVSVTGPFNGRKGVPSLVSDGVGGAFCTWEDERSIVADIYAQHINSNGSMSWAANGRLVCNAGNPQTAPVITPDGIGGAIVAWEDQRLAAPARGIYAQRVYADTTRWTSNGIVVYDASQQYEPRIALDGTGGAIIVWRDLRGGAYQLYAQHVNHVGSLLWNASGVAVCTTAGGTSDVSCISDGAGGAVVTWLDYRGASEMYAQRLSGSGSIRWIANGVALTTSGTSKTAPFAIGDGKGGALMAWHELRAPNSYNVYAQKVDSLGTAAWGTSGAAMATAINAQRYPSIVSDGAGGAIVAFDDLRNGTDTNIYAQEINGAGLVGGGLLPTGIRETPRSAVARLRQNTPNPFNPSTSISFDLDARSFVALSVFDVRGKEVAALIRGEMDAGTHTRAWNATGLASGVYLYRLSVVPAGGVGTHAFSETRKLVLLK